MSTTNAAPINQLSPLRRFIMTIQLDPTKALTFYGIIALLLATVLIGAIIGITRTQEQVHVADVENAPLRTGTAIVAGRMPWDKSTKLNPTNSGVSLDLRVENRRAVTPVVIDERTFAVRIGDRIQVKYRVGKSGAVYIEEWQPLAH